MNLRRKWAAIAASTGLGLSPAMQAADIDIYTQGSSSSAPNVLVFIDNTSNWTANDQQWNKTEVKNKCAGNATCESYVDQVFGNTSNLEQGRIELRALKLVLNELACATTKPLSINVGLMLLNTAGTEDSPSGNSGYISRRILPLEPGAESCTKLIEKLDLIDSKITEPDYKGPSSADYGSSLFEAFKYFGGYANTNNVAATAMGSPAGAKGFGPTRYSKAYSLEDPLAFGVDSSKTTYNSPIGEDFCGDNYILLIGNQFPNQEYGTDQNKTPPTNSVMGYLGLAPDQIFTVKNRSDIRFADEWSRFLATTDVSSVDGQQAVKTFAINVFNKTEDPKQTELLTNMAKYGGTGAGGVFKVGGDLGALIKALQSVLTQIAAVNSAFASASLPISVNTQGTYLNQVFIGMFRPDAGAKPRWAGNLKQYQFKLETVGSTRTLSLADANGDPAIDNANTGFLQGCARSFWTTDTDKYWETVTATPYKIPVGSCEKHENSDSPDGSIVERGGAAEKIRLASPSTRAIQTCDAASSNCTSSANFTPSSDLRKWIRGDNIGDGYDYFDINTSTVVKVSETYKKTTAETRPTIHGGVIHSRPLAINYGASGKDEVVVFYGADDGILRAINGGKDETKPESGKELWTFLPPEFESRLQRNHDNYPLVKFFDSPTDPKDFFFDGSLGAYVGPAIVDKTVIAKKYLYATMRRGGNMLYAFDITASPASGTPTPMWRFGCTDAANTTCFGGGDVAKIGQTWSTPRIVRVKGQSALYAVFGAGYDPCEDTEPRDCSKDITGHGLFVLDAQSGTQLRFIDFGAAAGHVVADIVPIDTNNDGYSDVIYAADTLGNLWRINLTDTTKTDPQNQSDWIVTHVAKVGDWSSTNEKNRKFLYAPDVVTVGAYNIVLIGTGNREKPLDTSKAALVKNRFYGFWDEYAKTSSYVLINDSNDCDASGDTTFSGCQVMNTSDVTLNYNDAFASTSRPRGWVIELDSTKFGAPYEQVVTTAATIGGYVNFSTFQAKNEKKCSSLGTARGYAACFLHGGASCDGAVAAGTNRSEKFVGGGLPPSPVAGTVEVDGKIVPFIIGGKPEAPGGSALEAKLPPIPIKKDRVKVYRYKQID